MKKKSKRQIERDKNNLNWYVLKKFIENLSEEFSEKVSKSKEAWQRNEEHYSVYYLNLGEYMMLSEILKMMEKIENESDKSK